MTIFYLKIGKRDYLCLWARYDALGERERKETSPHLLWRCVLPYRELRRFFLSVAHYLFHPSAAGLMSDRLVQSMEELGCDTLVLAECGHGYNSNRWEAAEWLAKKYGFKVKSILEIVADYLREGKIKLDPQLNQKLVTLRGPCNLVRLGGIVEEQRYLLKHAEAQIVATPCHNCVDQLSELNKHYELGVEIKTVCELVADALVLDK